MTSKNGGEVSMDDEDRMLRACGKYLKSIGWNAAVIQAKRIQGPTRGNNNYELVIAFLGAKAAKKPATKAPQEKS